MTDTDNKLTMLEERVGHIENKLDGTVEILASMNEKLKKLDSIETGIFGDEKIGYSGVIKTQASLQTQIDELKKEIIEINKVNSEQSIAINAKKSVKTDLLGLGKGLVQALINMFMFYLLFKGFLSPDALIKF